MGVKRETPIISVKGLLEQVRNAAEIQAAKFTQPADVERPPVVSETDLGKSEGKGSEDLKKEPGVLAGRRRAKKEKKKELIVPVTGTSEPVTAATMSPISKPSQDDVSGGDTDIDASDMRSPFGSRERKGDLLGKAQREMDALAGGEVSETIDSVEESVDPRTPLAVSGEEERKKIDVDAASSADAELPVLADMAESGELAANEVKGQEPPMETGSGESLDQKISRLKSEAESLRTAYAKADYDETNAWARVRKFFGKAISGIDEREWQEKQYREKENYRDGMYWQAQYQNTLVDLKSAELERIRRNAGDGTGWKKEMADMIRYFDLDEVTNLIDARTEYRAEKQNLPTEIFDSIGVVGRWYNRIPLKNKMYVTAALAGVTIASVASGGLAAGAMATALVGIRRFASGAGMAVGTEALLDNSRTKYQMKETEKEIEKLFAETPEKGFDYLETVISQKAFEIDDRLQKAKLTKLLHKTGALTVGIAVGSGWLSQIVMEKLGGGEAIDWVKEQFGGGASVSGTAPLSDITETPESSFAAPPESADMPAVPHEVPEESDFPIEDGDLGATEQIPIVPSDSGVEAEIMEPDPVDAFIDQDIVIQEGDSVWRIAGRLAQELGLEEKSPQSTRFINAIKDQYGDVLLKEGETINFAEHGIDKEFIEKALGDANALTPEQAASIAGNDTRIAEFAGANPDITLTDETIDTLLRDTPGTTGADMGQVTDDLQAGSPEGPDVSPEEELRTADMNTERDIVFGREYSLKDYTEYFRQNPEEFTKFKDLGDRYSAYIFSGNPDGMKTIGSMRVSEFHGDSKGMTDKLHQFMKMAKETYGNRLGLPSPKERVYEYVARMAMIGIEHPSRTAIRLPEWI